jgi:hypothetical protein
MALGSGLRPVADLILALNLMSSYFILFNHIYIVKIWFY